MDEELSGATLLAQALKTQGIEFMFGVVGVSVFKIAVAAQAVGIKYVGMRNEQAVSFARFFHLVIVRFLTLAAGVSRVFTLISSILESLVTPAF